MSAEQFTKYRNTVHNRTERVKARIRSAFSDARYFRRHGDYLNERLAEIRGPSAEWQRLPGPDRERMQGYIDGLHEWTMALVRFYYVTERGPIEASGGSSRLTDDECRNVDVRRYPRGLAWPPLVEGGPVAWFHGPDTN